MDNDKKGTESNIDTRSEISTRCAQQKGMPTSSHQRHQLRCEADRIAASDEIVQPAGVVPRNERVVSHPADVYRPPAFLLKTATTDEYRTLTELFQELAALNEEHAGEVTREAEVYLILTGADRPLHGAKKLRHDRSEEGRQTIGVCLTGVTSRKALWGFRRSNRQ